MRPRDAVGHECHLQMSLSKCYDCSDSHAGYIQLICGIQAGALQHLVAAANPDAAALVGLYSQALLEGYVVHI